jgi:hypothetical protein
VRVLAVAALLVGSTALGQSDAVRRIYDESTKLPSAPNLKFTGQRVTCTHDAASSMTTCDVPATVAVYYTAVAATMTDNVVTIVNFGTADIASANVTTGASWRYTSPSAERILVAACVTVVYPNPGASTYDHEAFFFKNGAQWRKFGQVRHVAVTGEITSCGTTVSDQAATDYIDVRVYQLTGANRVLLNASDANHISIVRL